MFDARGRGIHLYRLETDVILAKRVARRSVRYTNAKVILVGETSTGKTCLARALMGEPFLAQESTHGMKVWHFHTETAKKPGGEEITRDTLLWDLAGQPDYQVVHQLFLDETALGIVLFDPTHPETPFAGVGLWEKALRKVAGDDCPRLLVAGRVDRGRPAVAKRDIEAYLGEHGFRRFVATSAKTGEGVADLRRVIARMIPWDRLPVTSSPRLWRDIREYLLERRDSVDVLTRRADLRAAFRQMRPGAKFTDAEIDTVIGHAQAQGLVWRLSFGDFILLRPELLNDYASAIVRVARRHPKGLGSVLERDVLDASFDFEDLARIPDKETERSLMHAVVELLLRRELALREGQHLVFPSKFNRKLPDYPKPPMREVAYGFSGPVEDIYATLVTRLHYSGAFTLKDLWKNAGEFCDAAGNLCGFVLTNPNEGQGLLSVFFGGPVSLETKVLFLRFIHEHLTRRAIVGTVTRSRIYRCPACGREVDGHRVDDRLTAGKKLVVCDICDKEVALSDLLEEKFGDRRLLRQVRELEQEVDEQRSAEVGVTTAHAKKGIGEFDVFLAHNSRDRKAVRSVAEALKRRGLNPWLDVWSLPPGRMFQKEFDRIFPSVKAVAVFVGPKGMGPWEELEARAAIKQFVKRKSPVIPVLLPGVKREPELPLFLQEFSWVRFSKGIRDTDALTALEWGVTGERPDSEEE